MRFKLFLVALLSVISTSFIQASNEGKHEMSNMRVSIQATDFRNSRHIDQVDHNKKTYIKGKDSKYKQKESNRLLQPFVDYVFSSKLAGGEYVVTCFYRVDKKVANDECFLTLGVDEMSPRRLDIKESFGTHRISQTFDVKFLRGKNHTLKLWLPSKGVMIEKFEVRKKIINSKNKKDNSEE